MERYFYFRDVADEIDDDDASSSQMVPVRNITAIAPGTATNELDVWFTTHMNESWASKARLTVTKGKLKQVTEEIVSAMNAGPNHDGVTVIFDANTIVDSATSIEGLILGDNGVKSTRSLSSDITGVAIHSL